MLTMTEDDYFDDAAQGLRPYCDLEWYACDRSGNIAFLTSAGFAAVPLCVFRSRTGYFTAREFFSHLSVGGGHELREPGQRMPLAEDWVQMARRGLFAYDWDHGAGQYEPDLPYRLVAVPERPLTLSDVPSSVGQWLETVRFEGVDFSEAADLFVERTFAEVNL
jgi:hypothetical protein